MHMIISSIKLKWWLWAWVAICATPLLATEQWVNLLDDKEEAVFQLIALGDEDNIKELRQKHKKFNESVSDQESIALFEEISALREKYRIKLDGVISKVTAWNEIKSLMIKIRAIRQTAKNSLKLAEMTSDKQREYFFNDKLMPITLMIMELNDVYIYKIIEAVQKQEYADALRLVEDFAFLSGFVAPGGKGVDKIISHILLYQSMPNAYREKLRTLREELENRRFQFFRQDTSEVEKDK